MKRLIIILTVLGLSIATLAQVPQKISYQALIRDAENELVQNRTLTLQLSIVSSNGTTVYSETHQRATNENGVVSVAIGTGSTSGDFSKIDWSKGDYYVQTTTNLGGGEILVSGSSPLLSVPYALYAEKAGNAVEVDLTEYAKLSDIPAEADLSAYAKSSDVDATYVKKSDVDLSGYYSKTDVDNLVASLTAEIKELKRKLNPMPEGAIPAVFSVSADKQVYFSKGNLQYQASTNTWRFAENQLDHVGTQTPDNLGYFGGTVSGSDNANISETYEGWIDLFGWGTSGYNGKNPYMTSMEYSDYGDGANDIAGTNYDWGVYNAISNGGNKVGLWRTLSYDEWYYLRYARTNANALFGVAMVNGVNGCIFLPDNWIQPSNVTFTSGLAVSCGSDYYQTINNFTLSDWSKMEANGAVFLPTAGFRDGTGVVRDVGIFGDYWSCSEMGVDDAYALDFGSDRVSASSDYHNSGRFLGLSVRLVHDVE